MHNFFGGLKVQKFLESRQAGVETICYLSKEQIPEFEKDHTKALFTTKKERAC